MWKLWRPEIKGGIHICGCGHSGTSILTRIIGAHSKIYAIPGETGIAKKESYRRYRINIQLFERDTALNNAKIWVEKTPKHIRNLSFILNCAPSTKVVLITRNPKDTVASLKRRYGKLNKSIRRWKSDNARALRWLQHPQCILLKYEDLVINSEAVMANVMTFLGYSFEPEQLNFHQQQVNWYHGEQAASFTSNHAAKELEYGTEIHHNTYRNNQINQPLFNNIGSFNSYLTKAETEQTWRACGNLALALGYKSDDVPNH